MKQHRFKAPLAAIGTVLALLVVAPIASANHINATKTSASCTLVDNVPTITFKIEFEAFDHNTKPVGGTVKLDGTTVKTYSGVTWPDSQSNFTLTHTEVATAGNHTIAADFTWPNQGSNNGKVSKSVSCPTPKHPAISLEKTGAAFAYAGDTVTYAFAAKNTGDVALTNPTITDPKCISAPVRKAGETDTTFDVNDVWNFTCSYVVPSGVTAVDNTATACASYGAQEVCDTDDHHFPVRTIAIAVVKDAVETTAVAGTTVHFTITVTNTGNTAYVNYVYTDAACTPARTGGNAADASFDPGDVWTYGCEMATQVGQTSAHNTFSATGTNSDSKSATAQDDASVPLTQPSTPPGGTAPGQGTPTPSGNGVLPGAIVSGRARLRGPSGCAKNAFDARLTGRSIASVRFYLDGKLIKTFTTSKTKYSIKINPRRYGFGRHRLVAKVTFVPSSGTASRSIPLTFRRCAQGAVAPRFTG